MLKANVYHKNQNAKKVIPCFGQAAAIQINLCTHILGKSSNVSFAEQAGCISFNS